MSNIVVRNVIAFTDDEIPSGGLKNTKALYITIDCKGYTLPRALLDNGSSVNMIPIATLSRLLVDLSHMRKTHLVVRAFDGTRNKVIGNMELPIQIGPCIFNIDFQVMDINPSYNCLLGRPWIHMVKAVPSTLHQKVKFMVEEQLINVVAEDDIVTTLTTSNSYIDVDENVIECSFQSLEVVNATFVREGKKILMPRLSKITKMGVKQTVDKGAEAGFGLRKFLQRASKTIPIIMKQDCYGLGYKPNAKEKSKMIKRK